MKTQITTDYNTLTFQAKREFDAPLSLVWRAYTEAKLLDQWWAPLPWKTETKLMDFRPGGKWMYDMVGPEGERHGAIQLFQEIEFEVYFSGIDAFADEDGKIIENMPVATWKNSFAVTEHGTTVIVEAVYPNKEALETVIQMGMDQGVAMAQDNLATLLSSLNTSEK
jgi:uncharacterized protein YndB with AHSA1/START domain